MAIVKIPCCLKIMTFSNNCLLFIVLVGKRVVVGMEELLMIHHKQMISDEEMPSIQCICTVNMYNNPTPCCRCTYPYHNSFRGLAGWAARYNYCFVMPS